MAERKYFGTDGIRGKVGKYPITPEFVLKLGWAAGKVLATHGSRQVLIGKDTRISGYMLESALEAGLVSAGVSAAFIGPMPTPAIAYLTRTFRAEAGIVISASHNPYDDNGIKFFSTHGTKLPDDIELAIEAMLEQPMVCVESSELGRASRINDATGRYIEFCKSTFPAHLSLENYKIVIDCAHGAIYRIAPSVLRELGAEVIEMGTAPDGMNINQNCGATDTTELRKKVLELKADVGLAFDGDGDRLIMIDHLGHPIDGDQILFIIAREALREGKLQGGVVGTLMSNMNLEVALKQLSIPFCRAKVGDRYVLEKMNQQGWKFGGENSGHIIIAEKNTTGDGMIAALEVLAAMVSHHLSLHKLAEDITLFPQILINIRITSDKNPLLSDEVKAVTDEIEKKLGEKGRVLLRKSGTEPLIRVMVEHQDRQLAQASAEKIAQVIKQQK